MKQQQQGEKQIRLEVKKIRPSSSKSINKWLENGFCLLHWALDSCMYMWFAVQADVMRSSQLTISNCQSKHTCISKYRSTILIVNCKNYCSPFLLEPYLWTNNVPTFSFTSEFSLLLSLPLSVITHTLFIHSRSRSLLILFCWYCLLL